MSKIKISCLLTFLIFSLVSSVFAQDMTSKVEWIHQIGSWWLFLFIIGIALIFAGIIFGRFNLKIRKWSCIIGLVAIFVAIFGVEIIYLIPYLPPFGKSVVTYQECQGVVTTPSTPQQPDPIVTVVGLSACIFAGFAPSGYDLYTIVTFVIFGIIAPLAMLIALFYEFTDFLTHTGVRNVMAFLSALVAYRFLLSSLFIELLGYGFAGLGILLFDYFFFMIVFRAMKSLWKGGEIMEEVIKSLTLEETADVINRLDKLEEKINKLQTAMERAPAELKEELKRELEKTLKEKEELKKKAMKRPPRI
jgi:hypothetical protein